MKTTFLPKKYSVWLLKRKWLWFKTMIPIATFDCMDIDKTITYHIGYFQSRQEATTEAIKKAVELINESNG